MINNVGMETLIKSGSLGILVSLQRRRFRRCIASARLGSGAGGGGGGGGGAAAGGAAAAGGDAAGGAAEEKKATGSEMWGTIGEQDVKVCFLYGQLCSPKWGDSKKIYCIYLLFSLSFLASLLQTKDLWF